jgi:cytochrome c55X
MFVRAVLEGDPVCGMPGYRANEGVAQSIDDIYLYFAARANGTIDQESRPKSP